MKKFLLLVALILGSKFLIAQNLMNIEVSLTSNGCNVSGQYIQLAGNIGFLNVDTTITTNPAGQYGILAPAGYQGTIVAILQDSAGNWLTDCNGNYVLDTAYVTPSDSIVFLDLYTCCNTSYSFTVNGNVNLNCITLPYNFVIAWQSGGVTGGTSQAILDSTGNFVFTVPNLNPNSTITFIYTITDANGYSYSYTNTFVTTNQSGTTYFDPCTNLSQYGSIIVSFLDSNNQVILNYTGSLSLDCGITFFNVYTNSSGYFSTSYNIDSMGSCIILNGTDCNNNITSVTIPYNGIDTAVFIAGQGCGGSNPVNNLYSLCVYAYPQDSTLGNEETEFYLIQSYSTTSGDSLALVNSFIAGPNSAYVCFDSLSEGIYYVKAALTPNAPSYADYLPTYYNQNLLWSGATPINVNNNQYITLVLLPGINSGGPGFTGGYVSQGANRLDEAEATGDPMSNIEIVLTTEFGTPVKTTKTDANGYYSFSGIDFGTYKVYADVLNKTCEGVLVTVGDLFSPEVNFQVNSESIEGGIGLSDISLVSKKLSISILENPCTNNLNIVTINANEVVTYAINDILGRTLLTFSTSKDINKNKIDISKLSNGMFSITAISGTDRMTSKFVKQ
jgi:hypothetical protein